MMLSLLGFHRRYLTKELIPAYMNAVSAGDFTTTAQI